MSRVLIFSLQREENLISSFKRHIFCLFGSFFKIMFTFSELMVYMSVRFQYESLKLSINNKNIEL